MLVTIDLGFLIVNNTFLAAVASICVQYHSLTDATQPCQKVCTAEMWPFFIYEALRWTPLVAMHRRYV